MNSSKYLKLDVIPIRYSGNDDFLLGHIKMTGQSGKGGIKDRLDVAVNNADCVKMLPMDQSTAKN